MKKRMSIDDLTDDEEISRFRNEAYENLAELDARELAHYFKIGSESQRIIYKEFLQTQSKEYQQEFNDALADPLLGEREGDDFEDDEW